MVDGVGLVCAACSNQVEKDDKFCTSCRLKFSKFCWKCGERKVNCSCDNKIGGNALTPTKTLQDLFQQKGKEKFFVCLHRHNQSSSRTCVTKPI